VIKTKSCDIAVIGLGAHGAATAYQLSLKAKGKKVICFDQSNPPHDLGSTHGESRITRQAIGEGEVYTPLSLRSYEIWMQLERDTGEDCLNITGGLIMASKSSYGLHGNKDFLGETISAAKKYGISHYVFSAYDIRTRFPQFHLKGDEESYYEPMAGLLRPENCVRAQLKLAEVNGVVIKANDQVLGIMPGSDKVTIFAHSGIYEAGKVILTAGPWIKNLISKRYHKIFRIYRQVMYWFHPKESTVPYMPGKFPIFIWQFDTGFFYGFPMIGGRDGGVKVASEQTKLETDPELVDRSVSDEEKKSMYDNYIRSRLPGLSSNCAKAVTCLYTSTPDSHFVIDFHPEFLNVVIASPCSGHGFKHSAAIGQILAELAVDGKTSFDISQFSLNRFEIGIA